MSVLEALERLLVELQILVHLVLELGQLHETQLGQIKHLRLAGLVRHFDFGDEKLVNSRPGVIFSVFWKETIFSSFYVNVEKCVSA